MPAHGPSSAPALMVRQGPFAGKRAVISQTPYTIGRDARCQLHPPDPGLAPLHAVIRLHEGAYYVQDRGSATGTLVNGRPIKTARLQPGDCLRVGTLELEFQLQTQPAPRPTGTLRTTPAPAAAEFSTPHYPDTQPGYSIIPYANAAASPYADDAPVEATPPPPTRPKSNPWIGRLYMAALLVVGLLLLVVALPDMLGTNTASNPAAPPPGFNASSGATVLYFYADW